MLTPLRFSGQQFLEKKDDLIIIILNRIYKDIYSYILLLFLLLLSLLQL